MTYTQIQMLLILSKKFHAHRKSQHDAMNNDNEQKKQY